MAMIFASSAIRRLWTRRGKDLLLVAAGNDLSNDVIDELKTALQRCQIMTIGIRLMPGSSISIDPAIKFTNTAGHPVSAYSTQDDRM